MKNSTLHEIERDMMKRSADMGGLAFLARGGASHLVHDDFKHTDRKSLLKLEDALKDPTLQKMMKAMNNYSTYADFENEEGDTVKDVLHIRLGALADDHVMLYPEMQNQANIKSYELAEMPWRPLWASTVRVGHFWQVISHQSRSPSDTTQSQNEDENEPCYVRVLQIFKKSTSNISRASNSQVDLDSARASNRDIFCSCEKLDIVPEVNIVPTCPTYELSDNDANKLNVPLVNFMRPVHMYPLPECKYNQESDSELCSPFLACEHIAKTAQISEWTCKRYILNIYWVK